MFTSVADSANALLDTGIGGFTLHIISSVEYQPISSVSGQVNLFSSSPIRFIHFTSTSSSSIEEISPGYHFLLKIMMTQSPASHDILAAKN